MNKAFLFVLGIVVLIFGMALVLHYWAAAVTVFKGVIPSAIAIAGLVMMFAATLKK